MELRKVYAPFSQSAENTGTTPVEGYIDVNQAIYPAVNTGIINEDGEWVGIKSSDKEFTIGALAEAIPNTGEVLFPGLANLDAIDMTGFADMFIAINPSRGGNFAITAIQGPDDKPFANLFPIAPARALRGTRAEGQVISDLLLDTAEDCQTDQWNIFYIGGNLRNQKRLQFKVVNNSGGESNINFAFLRVVK